MSSREAAEAENRERIPSSSDSSSSAQAAAEEEAACEGRIPEEAELKRLLFRLQQS